MSEIKIEKGVPMPKPRAQRAKYPWRELGVGDSFFVPGAARARCSVGAVHSAQRIGGGVRFTVRTVEGGVRVWRIA